MKFLKKTSFVCYALDNTATYPGAIWDGDSGNRDSDDGDQRAPDHRDWARALGEIQAVQRSNQGVDPDNALNSVGTAGTTTGVSAVERGNAAMHKTIITLADVAIAMNDGGTPATDANWGTLELYTFPEGHVILHSAHMVFPVAGFVAVIGGGTGLSDTADLEVGVGTTGRGNASNFALQTAEHDIVPEQTGVDLVAGSSDAIESRISTRTLRADGSAAAKTANLNIITSDDADSGTTDDILTTNGVITLIWSMVGDN